MINKNQDITGFSMVLYRYLYKSNDVLSKLEKMLDYSNIMEVLRALRARGLSNYFYLNTDNIECAKLHLELYPEDFDVKEVYLFEGGSSPNDNPVLYVIETKDGVEGVLVNSYGANVKSVNLEMAKKLSLIN